MSNGYLLAAESDIETARAIADGFGLDVISAGSIADRETTGAALAAAPNVGLILSAAAAQDEAYVTLLQSLAQRLERAQLILIEPNARDAFSFLPEAWPAMSLEEAQLRASELARQREDAAAAPSQQAHAPPQQAEPETPAAAEDGEPPAIDRTDDLGAESAAPAPEPPAPAPFEDPPIAAGGPTAAPPAEEPEDIPSFLRRQGEFAAPRDEPEPPPAPQMPPSPEPPTLIQPAPEAPAPSAPAQSRASVPSAPPQAAPRTGGPALGQTRARSAEASAPADATAFAPKKLRRETPELVRIVIHQPKDLQAVIKAARKIDRRAEPAPQSMSIGDIALGASIGVALDVRGARCDGTLQRRTWTGEPVDFSFTAEAEAGVKQAVFLARVFINDAQIGVLAFTRQIRGPAKKPTGLGDRARLKRHKRVFLSYSSRDRETVAAIATAYQMAGVQHFWDRASLKSGEEWSPRLRREIDRSDLFHLCWSRSAASSEWVHKEAEHALTRRRRSSGKRPEITVQMLDGPPWAPHPPELDAINFDDFVRAAIVGYARGEGNG